MLQLRYLWDSAAVSEGSVRGSVMKRIKIIAAYDGTAYHGWQIQPEARTVGREKKKSFSGLFGGEIRVIRGRRTDAGVHALGNVAVFDTETKMEPSKISYAMNQRLPEDIRILDSRQVADDFHPRHCDTVKTYEYRIYRAEFPMPVRRLYTYFTYHKLDVMAMREACAYLEGKHDFKSFCSAHASVESTVRTLYLVDIREEGPELVISISGNGFLYNMVRIIAGTLLDVGMGKYPAEHVAEIVNACDRSKAGPTVPACGLTLVSYQFPGNGKTGRRS